MPGSEATMLSGDGCRLTPSSPIIMRGRPWIHGASPYIEN
jgi:hypothetical protein